MPQHHLDGLDPVRGAKRWRRILEETEPSRGGVLVAVAEGGGVIGFVSFGPSRDSETDLRGTGEVRARRFYALAGWAEDGMGKTDGSYGFDIAEVRYRRMLGRCV